jgi:hypothetical protein
MSKIERTILIVDDSPEDREKYLLRYILKILIFPESDVISHELMESNKVFDPLIKG